MVSWLAARNDDEHYGELVLFKFPKQSTIYGPLQVESRISNDSEISQNLNLWDQQGSSVIRSNMPVSYTHLRLKKQMRLCWIPMMIIWRMLVTC